MSELYTKLGKLLKAERERQNRPLSEVSLDLKITEAHLLAIETGDLAGVPSELYFKLFAKSYAEALGLDYVKVIDVIRDDVGEEEYDTPETGPVPSAGPSRPSMRPSVRSGVRSRPTDVKHSHKGTWFLIGLALIILGGVAWLVISTNGKSFLSGGESDTTQAADLTNAGDTGSVASGNPSRENSAIDLDLIARDRTWAVVIADGDTALQTNLKPWREYYIGAQESLVVSIGSPLSVEIMLNGTAANLRHPEDGTISSVVITPENALMYLQPATTDTAGDTTATDTTGNISGTGSSPTRQETADTSSTGRGTTDGT